MACAQVIADYARGLAHVSPGFYAGTLLVFIGFQLESYTESKEGSVDEAHSTGIDERDGAGSDVGVNEAAMCTPAHSIRSQPRRT